MARCGRLQSGGRPAAVVLAAGLLGCLAAWGPATWAEDPAASPSTLLIRNVHVLDPELGELRDQDILVRDGRIARVARSIEAPGDARVEAGRGRWATPGIVDIHTHLGTATLPYVPVELETWDVNELSDPNTAQMLVEDAVDPQDPGFERALAGGVTTLQVLPGSANLFGGRSVVLRNIPATTVSAMKFPGARRVLKMACGENPKYTWGPKSRQPYSRMGVAAGIREAFARARGWQSDENDAQAPPWAKVLSDVLDGEIAVHMHCYTAAEMALMMDLAEEIGFGIAAFHHAAEAYKIPELLREHGACAVVWADVWGFKMETLDAIPENAAFTQAGGACVALHSDLPRIGARLNVEAARARAAGRRAGLQIDRAQALSWITSRPAEMLGIGDRVGTLKVGHDADLVIWSGDPFSITSLADAVFIQGRQVHDRNAGAAPRSDFELGQPARQAP